MKSKVDNNSGVKSDLNIFNNSSRIMVSLLITKFFHIASISFAEFVRLLLITQEFLGRYILEGVLRKVFEKVEVKRCMKVGLIKGTILE